MKTSKIIFLVLIISLVVFGMIIFGQVLYFEYQKNQQEASALMFCSDWKDYETAPLDDPYWKEYKNVTEEEIKGLILYFFINDRVEKNQAASYIACCKVLNFNCWTTNWKTLAFFDVSTNDTEDLRYVNFDISESDMVYNFLNYRYNEQKQDIEEIKR
jgi:hypothetical protein